MIDVDGFARRLFTVLLERAYRIAPDPATGWDPTAPERGASRLARAKDAVVAAAARAGLARRRFDTGEGAAALARLAGGLEAFARTDALLADDRSRSLLLDLLAFRVLGPSHVPLPVRRREIQARIAAVAAAPGGPDAIAWDHGRALRRRSAPGREGPIELFTHPATLVWFFELEQYAYRHGSVEVAVEPGDAVVDGGGGWGETALYFADRAGPGGRVVCFEFEPASLRVLRRNLEANPRLADRVDVVERALWSGSGERVPYSPAGLSSSVGEGEASVATESVDGLGLERVGFVKLDVEGAEMAALRGAESTIRRDRPKLAIAAYHRDEDLAEIPAWIDGLGVGYRMYVDHFSPGWSETILFAVVPDDAPVAGRVDRGEH